MCHKGLTSIIIISSSSSSSSYGYLAPSDERCRITLGTARHRDRLDRLSLVDRPRSTGEVRRICTTRRQTNTDNHTRPERITLPPTKLLPVTSTSDSLVQDIPRGRSSLVHSPWGQPFFYMAFACCVNVYTVSVHPGST